MMDIVKKNIRNVVVAILLIVVLIVVGLYNLSCTKAIEEKRSSYTRTEFDYIVELPSQNDLSELSNLSSVEDIYAFHLYTNLFSGSSKASAVKAFVSTANYKQSEKLGFLGEGTLIKGSFDGEGAILDETASEVLGAGVGDTVSFVWGSGAEGKTFTQTVKGICIACSYSMYTDGLVLLDYTNEMVSAYNIENETYVYTGAFVKVENSNAYSSVKEIVGNDKNVDVKENLYEANAKHKTETLENQVNSINLGMIFAVAVLYSGICALFILINKKNDQMERDSGVDQKKMFSSYVIGGGACALAVCLISFVTLLIAGILTHFIDEGIKTVLALSLPSLVAIPVIYLVSKTYTDKLYANNSKEEPKSLRDEEPKSLRDEQEPKGE